MKPYRYYVVYDVEGHGKQKAGPWLFDEALEQLKDIRGFEHISNARMECEPMSEQP